MCSFKGDSAEGAEAFISSPKHLYLERGFGHEAEGVVLDRAGL